MNGFRVEEIEAVLITELETHVVPAGRRDGAAEGDAHAIGNGAAQFEIVRTYRAHADQLIEPFTIDHLREMMHAAKNRKHRATHGALQGGARRGHNHAGNLQRARGGVLNVFRELRDVFSGSQHRYPFRLQPPSLNAATDEHGQIESERQQNQAHGAEQKQQRTGNIGGDTPCKEGHHDGETAGYDVGLQSPPYGVCRGPGLLLRVETCPPGGRGPQRKNYQRMRNQGPRFRG